MKKSSWWNSLEHVSKIKRFLAWTVLLVLPVLACIAEFQQKVLERRSEVVERSERIAQETAYGKERAALKEEIATLEEKYGPRSITAEQKQKLLNAFASAPKGRISIAIVWGDDEAQQFGTKLTEVVREIGYEVIGGGVWGMGSPAGLWMHVNSDTNLAPHAEILLSGLRSAGVKIEARSDSRIPSGEVRLYVGTKPVPSARK